jgi:hypothetical protein
MQRMEVESKEKLTGSVEEARAILGIGRNQAYEAIKRGEIPHMTVNKRIIVLWQPFIRKLRGE